VEWSEQSDSAPKTIEDHEHLLKALGWGMASMVCLRNGSTVYLVTCNRDKDWLIGNGDSQLKAWQDAAEQASAKGSRPTRASAGPAESVVRTSVKLVD
jgi:hypothetical protein